MFVTGGSQDGDRLREVLGSKDAELSNGFGSEDRGSKTSAGWAFGVLGSVRSTDSGGGDVDGGSKEWSVFVYTDGYVGGNVDLNIGLTGNAKIVRNQSSVAVKISVSHPDLRNFL